MSQKMREIKSYVRREGRMTHGQAFALEHYWSEWGFDYIHKLIDPNELYKREAPWVMEIGFGNGQHLADMATAHPQYNYLGIEVFRPGVGALMLTAQARGLQHLKVCCHDAVELLRDGVAPGALQALYVICPDPWPKRKHHKRRLLQAPFLQCASERLAVGGKLIVATDHTEYAQHIQREFSSFENLQALHCDSEVAKRIAATKYAQRGHRLQHNLWIGVFVRQK